MYTIYSARWTFWWALGLLMKNIIFYQYSLSHVWFLSLIALFQYLFKMTVFKCIAISVIWPYSPPPPPPPPPPQISPVWKFNVQLSSSWVCITNGSILGEVAVFEGMCSCPHYWGLSTRLTSPTPFSLVSLGGAWAVSLVLRLSLVPLAGERLVAWYNFLVTNTFPIWNLKRRMKSQTSRNRRVLFKAVLAAQPALWCY